MHITTNPALPVTNTIFPPRTLNLFESFNRPLQRKKHTNTHKTGILLTNHPWESCGNDSCASLGAVGFMQIILANFIPLVYLCWQRGRGWSRLCNGRLWFVLYSFFRLHKFICVWNLSEPIGRRGESFEAAIVIFYHFIADLGRGRGGVYACANDNKRSAALRCEKGSGAVTDEGGELSHSVFFFLVCVEGILTKLWVVLGSLKHQK